MVCIAYKMPTWNNRETRKNKKQKQMYAIQKGQNERIFTFFNVLNAHDRNVKFPYEKYCIDFYLNNMNV